jgi:protein-arginine kinase activator protein McsA
MICDKCTKRVNKLVTVKLELERKHATAKICEKCEKNLWSHFKKFLRIKDFS